MKAVYAFLACTVPEKGVTAASKPVCVGAWGEAPCLSRRSRYRMGTTCETLAPAALTGLRPRTSVFREVPTHGAYLYEMQESSCILRQVRRCRKRCPPFTAFRCPGPGRTGYLGPPLFLHMVEKIWSSPQADYTRELLTAVPETDGAVER